MLNNQITKVLFYAKTSDDKSTGFMIDSINFGGLYKSQSDIEDFVCEASSSGYIIPKVFDLDDSLINIGIKAIKVFDKIFENICESEQILNRNSKL